MDIFRCIKDDHGKQRGLAAGLAETSGDTDERRRLFKALKMEIEAHAAAEEQTFYADLIAHTDSREKARHSIAEHADAATLIQELELLDFGSGGWLNKFKKLKDELEHHMAEEEDDVFPVAQRVINGARAETLGADFEALKSEKIPD